jgi:hypothetical protein
MSSNFKDSLKNEANQNLSFPEKRAPVTSAGGEISPTPGHLDDRIRLILDEALICWRPVRSGLGNRFESLGHFKHKWAQGPLAKKITIYISINFLDGMPIYFFCLLKRHLPIPLYQDVSLFFF